MRGRNRIARILGSLLLATSLGGCAYQVIPMSETPPAFAPPETPLYLTIAVREGSFEKSALNPNGILEYFANELRDARLFQGVIHPTPPDVTPIWELEIAASDGGIEPNSNFWKGFVSNVLPPLLFVTYLQNDYTLELQALLLRNRELVETYRAESVIRHRYQAYANKQQMQAEALDLLARRATREILGKIAADAARLRRENASIN